MATINSNTLTPQQAALNKKKTTDPFSLLKASSVPVPAVLPKPTMVQPAAPARDPNVNYNLPKPTMTTGLIQAPQQATALPKAQPQQNAAVTAPVTATAAPEKQTSMPQSLLGEVLRALISRGTSSSAGPAAISAAGAQNDAAAADAKKITDSAAQQIADIGGKGARFEAGQLTTGTTPVAEGNAAVTARTTAAEQSAVSDAANMRLAGVDKSLTAASQKATAETNAAGAANNAASTALTAPLVSALSAGGGDMSSAVKLQVDRVLNGSSSYDQAVQALSAYGQLGVNELQRALGPNFDIAASNANAAAKAQALGQNVQQGKAAANAAISAKQALDALQVAYNGLSALQTGSIGFGQNVPVLSQLEQFASMASGVGRERTSAYVTALNEARAQVRGVLGMAGVNPTDAGDIVDTLLPSGMKPAEVPAKISAAKNYLDQRVAALSTTEGVPQLDIGAGGGSSGKVTGFSW